MTAMDEKQRKEEKEKLRQLRKELEEKVKDIIPEALRSHAQTEVVEERISEAVELDETGAKRVIEALLFAASRPLTPRDLTRVLKQFTAAQLKKLVYELREEYERENRSFRINEIAQGFEISTLPQYHSWIIKSEKERARSKSTSLAALETLSILAYKQPITRVEIEEIRGVDASGVLATLLERDLIRIVGRKEVPGKPLLYGTTDTFLEMFGMASLNDLPNISEIKDLVEATIKKEELLRKENIVTIDNEASEALQAEEQDEQDKAEQISLADRYEEISQEIDSIKIKSERQVRYIIDPEAEEKEKQEKLKAKLEAEQAADPSQGEQPPADAQDQQN